MKINTISKWFKIIIFIKQRVPHPNLKMCYDLI